MPATDLAAWVAFSLTERIGSKTLRSIIKHFDGDLRAALAADSQTLQQIRGIGPKTSASIQAIDLDGIEREIPRWQSAGVSFITLNDDNYPARLRSIDDPPPTLFVRGSLQAAAASSRKCVAIVGTRQPTSESLGAARRLGMELAERDVTIVSGLALGIDTAGHMGALDAGGQTLAVLGGGVLNVYPQVNALLARTIVGREAGALLCEVHPKASASAANLVARNRLISGLADAVIVVETESDGGAMYAAKRALEQGRRVYALDNAATGNRELLEAGITVLNGNLQESLLHFLASQSENL
ncbi:MAG: DNA-protecting protein DprA [Burkholderiales bacterium]|nr:DNA-protecting protein DprA [Anaerolineae bacterium]